MSSFHQITLGAGCVVGAFLLGHYLNRPLESIESPEQMLAKATDLEWRPSLLEPADPKIQLPSYRNRSNLDLGFDSPSTLPPPSDLATEKEPDRSAAQTNDWQANSSRNSEIGLSSRFEPANVEVPDFSQLAAQFRGTNLELPPSPQPKSDGSHALQTLAQRDQRPLTKINPPNNELRYEQNYAAPVDPDRLDDNALSIERSRFQPTEFAPQLREHPSQRTDRRSSEVSVLESNAPIGLATNDSPVEYVDRTNRVISYNDPFPPLKDEVANAIPNHNPRSNDRYHSSSRPLDNESLSPQQRFRTAEPGMSDGSWHRRNNEDNPSVGPMQSIQKSHREDFEDDRREKDNRIPPNRERSTSFSNSGQLEPLGRSPDQRIEVTATRFIDHQTRSGETLSSISNQYFGKPDFYLDIYLVNQTRMRHPGDLQPGTILKIPVYD